MPRLPTERVNSGSTKCRQLSSTVSDAAGEMDASGKQPRTHRCKWRCSQGAWEGRISLRKCGVAEVCVSALSATKRRSPGRRAATRSLQQAGPRPAAYTPACFAY